MASAFAIESLEHLASVAPGGRSRLSIEMDARQYISRGPLPRWFKKGGVPSFNRDIKNFILVGL